MRHALMGMMFSIALLGAQPAYADFCDPPIIDDSTGGGRQCQQSRSSLHQPAGQLPGQRGALPNYSELDLVSVYPMGGMSHLYFDLDIQMLALRPPVNAALSDHTRIDVMELDIFGTTYTTNDPGTYRVLTMSMERPLNSVAYKLKFSWRDPSLASPSTGATGEVNFATVEMAATERRVIVLIRPAGTEGGYDWKSISVDVSVASENDDGSGYIGRPVELNYNQPPGFSIPLNGMGFMLAQPVRLRSGVIAGDIQRAGMTTDFMFLLPFPPSTE